MQPLKEAENLLCMFGGNADPVVADGKFPEIAFTDGANTNSGRKAFAILQRVIEEVLEELKQVDFLYPDVRQFSVFDLGAGFLAYRTEVCKRLVQHAAGRNRLVECNVTGNHCLRVGKKPRYQGLHPLRAFSAEAQQFLCSGFEFLLVSRL